MPRERDDRNGVPRTRWGGRRHQYRALAPAIEPKALLESAEDANPNDRQYPSNATIFAALRLWVSFARRMASDAMEISGMGRANKKFKLTRALTGFPGRPK